MSLMVSCWCCLVGPDCLRLLLTLMHEHAAYTSCDTMKSTTQPCNLEGILGWQVHHRTAGAVASGFELY